MLINLSAKAAATVRAAANVSKGAFGNAFKSITNSHEMMQTSASAHFQMAFSALGGRVHSAIQKDKDEDKRKEKESD